MVASNTEQKMVAHLLRRAGFGYSPLELKYYCQLGYDRTLDALLNPQNVNNSNLDALIARQQFDFTKIADLRRWWLYRMCFSNRPLEEKMTLFWHGHFATSQRKVQHSYSMYMQNQLFRRYALGNFHGLLKDISRDPAMIVWLDNQQNKKGSPNENYAREIMELFTLGIGNYSEKDIKEAARAFTGWQTTPVGFYLNNRLHDNGLKTVFGVTGNLGGDDVIWLLVQKPATGKRLATKLIKFFVCENPPQEYIDSVAKVYIDSHYNIKSMLTAIFSDPFFNSANAYHARIKSPAELVVGSLKTLQINKLDKDLPEHLARMGQSLFEPPNVKGWDGGPAWISTDTMMERFNFAEQITANRFDEMFAKMSPSELVSRENLTSAKQVVDYFLGLFVDGDVPANTRAKLIAYVSSDTSGNPISNIGNNDLLDTKLRGLVRIIMTLPTYQLC